MGLFDKLRKGKDQAAGLAKQHEDKIDSGIDKAADVIDDKTGGKHTDKIDEGAEKAKDAIDKLTDDGS